MKNPFMNINRIEFLVTLYCTGKCKHCSLAPELRDKSYRYVDPQKASDTVEKLTEMFDVDSLMTFGGEPLLFPEVACRIQKTACQCGIAHRQIITNGYFSKNSETIKKVASAVHEANINEVLISVDAFHQETIPLEYVRLFAESLLEQKVENIQFHPAWVINASNQNRYNEMTHRILDSLSDLKINVSDGNDIFPAGNAEKYLQEFYPKPEYINLDQKCGEVPYTDRLDDVHSLSIEPNGNVVVCPFSIGNIYQESIETIIDRYNPYNNRVMKALTEGGVKSLVDYAESRGIGIDTGGCYSACSVCRKTVAALNALS